MRHCTTFFVCILLLVGLTLTGCGPQQPGPEPPPPQREGPVTNQDAGPPQDTAPPKPACDAGTAACRCRASDVCDAGLRCTNGICQVCPAGTAGCACEQGNTCQGALKCTNGTCQGCEGQSHCSCYGNNTCDVNNRCEISNNGSTTCIPCEKGQTLGCNCNADADCGSLLCINKRCADPAVLKSIPQNPKCYTPCEGNLQNEDGSILYCDPKYKLREGCASGQVCNEGSCIPTDLAGKLTSNQYPYCKGDMECPDWQTCLEGRCYSNCVSDSGCPTGFQCHRYVCRRTCNVRKSVCTKTESCLSQSPDGDGLCQPKLTRRMNQTQRNRTRAVFVVSPTEVIMTKDNPTGRIYLENKSDFQVAFTIQRTSDDTGSKTPLSWLQIERCQTYNPERSACTKFDGKPSSQEPFTVTVEGKQSIILRLVSADKHPPGKTSYLGAIEILNNETKQPLQVRYHQSAAGRWRGRLYSFGNFDDTNADKFPNDGNLKATDLKNALLQQWLLFKRNQLSFEKLQAVLQSLQDKTWDNKQTQEECQRLYSQTNSTDLACYPFSSSNGYELLTSSRKQSPPPSGVSALDFTIDLEEKPGNLLSGRIVSQEALQYPGNPSIQLVFNDVPGQQVKSYLKSLDSTIVMGGRYEVGENQGCTDTTTEAKVTLPWLLLDFLGGTSPFQDLIRARYACRTKNVPVQPKTGATQDEKAQVEQYNQSLSSANPVPNGRGLRRTLSLVDGMLYQNRIMLVLVKETFPSFLPSTTDKNLNQKLVRYGYLLLERIEQPIQDFNTQGTTAPSVTACTSHADCSQGQACQNGECLSSSQLLPLTCTPGILTQALGFTVTTPSVLASATAQQLNDLVSVLITGQTASISSDPAMGVEGRDVQGQLEFSYTDNGKTFYIHYFCEDTGQFDGGPVASPKACPASSKVTFFALPDISAATLRAEGCQAKGTCKQKLGQLTNSTIGFRLDVPYRCKGTNQLFCDDPNDLRRGKVFYKKSTGSKYISPYAPIEDDIKQAFRYRLKFVNRSGQNIGFTPVICQSNANTPYCYDPKGIEALAERINCLEHVHSTGTLRQRLSTEMKSLLQTFLKKTFSFTNTTSNGVVLTHYGFETLNAELRIMLGDEAYTQALSGRFDLAATRQYTFPGELLEPNGIQLSGTLGYEMMQLYASTQYYQSVLDRFYRQTGVFASSFASAEAGFLNLDSVTSLFQKVMLAASRKTRSWSTIAKKYHTMNRLDLAKHVLERAYISAYIEMMVITSLLKQLMLTLGPDKLDQLRIIIRDISRTYSAALLDMKETYAQVSRQEDLFGLPPNTIPFPALDRYSSATLRTNAFEVSLGTLKQAVFNAKDKESIATQFNRAYDTQAALFQSELAKIQTSYNTQLGEICGTIQVGDQILPAIPGNMDPKAANYSSNPCGRVPGSALYDAYLALERIAINVPQLAAQRSAIVRRIDDERDRIRRTCNATFALSDVVWTYQEKSRNLSQSVSETQVIMQQAIQAGMGLIQLAASWKCEAIIGDATGGSCQFAKTSNAVKAGLIAAQAIAVSILSIRKLNKEKELAVMGNQLTKSNLRVGCEVCPPNQPNCGKPGVAKIASQNYIAQLTLQLGSFELQTLQIQLEMQRAASQIQQLKNEARRLQRDREEAVTLLTRVQAAQNDPNTRIYKNDSVIAAERTFQRALQEAYRTTLIYEYYTGTTYKRKGDLFLIRMVGVGDKNLEIYTSQLEQAFRDFEEVNSKPDIRVSVVSLRDDILKIAQTKPDKSARMLGDRIAEFQQQLLSRDNLTPEGYVSFAFNLAVQGPNSVVSPITFNHKVLYIEAEIVGGELGDDVGRLYVWQKGTGVVRQADGTMKYYNLPARVAVINPYFNGTKVFEPNVYQNYRLQDRPLGNSQWVLQFNQASETANQDINIATIDDIRLYIYYSDFTQ
ncbi:MAG: hypothetical protein EP343_21865 [Deltaproteobacteria bacterium]|nr:MAG: hypothetical protein EP343_21865 [Deltaproteobacteria bacterium]